MTEADVQALFERWRALDAVGAAAYFAEDARYREPRHDPIGGRDAIVAHWAEFFARGPVWRFVVHERFGDERRFVVLYTWEMEQADGSWRGKPGCAVVHLRDGLIAAWDEYEG